MINSSSFRFLDRGRHPPNFGMCQRLLPIQEQSEPNFPLLDTQYVLQYEPSPAIIGPDADVEADEKQLQPVDRQCCESTTSASPMPQCNSLNKCRPSDAHEHHTQQCGAVTDTARVQLHTYSKQGSCPQHTCLSQPGEDTKVCCQLTEHAGASVDAKEEALTLQYQPVNNQHMSADQGVYMLDSSEDAATTASITGSSSVSKTCHKRTLTGHRERVWHNKRYRRDGLIDLWTRKGLQLQPKRAD